MSERIWFKIGEAAESVGVSAREIRYWEKKIPEIRPRRSKGNLRHFHRDDLPKLKGIAAWVGNGYTVAECRELLVNGSITRDLGLYTDEPETISGNDISGPEPLPDTETGLNINHFSQVKIMGHASSKLELEKIIDSVRVLLTRLQNPIS